MKSIEVSIQLSKPQAFCCRCRPLVVAQMRWTFSLQFSSIFSRPTLKRAMRTSTSRMYISAYQSQSSWGSPGLISCSCWQLLSAAGSILGSEMGLCSCSWMMETADLRIFLPKVRFWKGSAGSVVSSCPCEKCSLSMRARFCYMVSMSFIRSQLINLITRIRWGLDYIYLEQMEDDLMGQVDGKEEWEWNWWVVAGIFVAVTLANFVFLLVFTIIKQLTPMPDLLSKYCSPDKRSWAVVTGATDGIGLGFCEVLTQLGFNLVLISRNPQKLERTKQSLLGFRPAHFASSQLRSIVFDFKDSSDPQKWQGMASQLRELDIALLVNNVGTSEMILFEHYTTQQIVDIINVNCVSMAAMGAQVGRLMEKRGRRSAMINLSSFLGEKAVPYVSLYCATKAFNKEFSNSLAMECPNIDVLCLKPMFVESPLSRQKRGLGVPDRRECAWDSLKELRWIGWSNETYGYYSHRLMGFAARNFVPDWLYRIVIRLGAKRSMQKIAPESRLD